MNDKTDRTINQVSRQIVTNEQMVQRRIWEKLTRGNIPPLTSRYVAREIQMKGVIRIIEVVKTMPSTYTITGDNGRRFHIIVNPIDIPSAEIKEMKV